MKSSCLTYPEFDLTRSVCWYIRKENQNKKTNPGMIQIYLISSPIILVNYNCKRWVVPQIWFIHALEGAYDMKECSGDTSLAEQLSQWLLSLCPILECLSSIPSSGSQCQLVHPDVSRSWVPATHMGYLDQFPSSMALAWPWLRPPQTFGDFVCTWNPALYLCLWICPSLSFSVFLSADFQKRTRDIL